MNSINEQQPEENRENLQGDKAVAKLTALVKQASTCFFCTAIKHGAFIPTRPMSVQKVDEQGSLWFLCANDSRLHQQIKKDAAVQLMFQGSAHSDFLTLYGRATLSADKQKIKDLWEPILKTWFTEGENDPRIAVIQVTPSDGYYWDTRHSRPVALAKMVVGAITGTTLDDSVEGTLKV